MKLRHLTLFLYFIAALWLVFAILWFFRNSDYRYFYSSVGLVYTLVLSLSAYFIGKKQLWAWWLAVAFISVSLIASIFDEIGWIDIVAIAITSFVLVKLIKGRSLITGN
ncbi:MAG: hypothetical protein ACOX6N_03350 [Patescibacteria group bacterium]|jgi:phosphoglycerol transferase MdoB-like AlkP superfamily enzyme